MNSDTIVLAPPADSLIRTLPNCAMGKTVWVYGGVYISPFVAMFGETSFSDNSNEEDSYANNEYEYDQESYYSDVDYEYDLRNNQSDGFSDYLDDWDSDYADYETDYESDYSASDTGEFY